jgi:hypothetical protein
MVETRGPGAALLRPEMLVRVAAWFYLGAGAVTLVTLPLPAPRGTNRLALVAVAVGAIVVGALTLVVPWQRWNWRVTLVLVALAFILIATGNVAGAGPDYTYGVYFVLVFVWVGIAHPRWTSLLISPAAALAYVVPIVLAGGDVAQKVSTVAVTIPSACWSASRWRSSRRVFGGPSGSCASASSIMPRRTSASERPANGFESSMT